MLLLLLLFLHFSLQWLLDKGLVPKLVEKLDPALPDFVGILHSFFANCVSEIFH